MNARNLVIQPAVRVLATLSLSLFVTVQHASAQSSPSAYTWGTRYDLMGRVTGTIAPDPDGAGPLRFLAVRNTYDGAGRLVRVQSGQLADWEGEDTEPSDWSGFAIHQTVDTTYDAQGRKKLELVKGSNGVATSATQYSYDSLGRLACTAVRMNPAVYGNLPSSACTLGTAGSFGPDRITKNIYNNVGQLWKVQKAVGTSLAQDYATYTYSPNGNRESVTDARGYRAEMDFDGFDRQSRWYFPSPTSQAVASTSDYEAYGYDGNGNRTSLRKRDGSTLTYHYDALNRMTVKVVPERAGLDSSHTRDVYYGYDSFGRMTYARFDSVSGQGITMGYNGFSEVTSLTTSLPGLSTSLSFLFDKDGNRTRITYSDNNYVTYGYDGMDRSANVLRGGSATLASYTYNASGRRASMGGGLNTSYEYYPDGRLWHLTNTPVDPSYVVQYDFNYNPASQITQLTRSNDAYAWTGATNVNQTYVVNGLNQYTSVAGTSFSHDANGNLTSDGSTTYLYDVENRLVSASGAKNAQLRYDPLGRLYEISGGASGTTRFAYDGDALVQEFDSSGNLLRRYVHGTDAGDDPIVWLEGSGFTDTQQRLLRTDHLGSVVSITDATSANVLAINTYDPYGVPGAANQGKFQYTGQAWVSELGMYYYKSRMYSPALGRFMQIDPIGYVDDLNLYAYVGNDPLNSTDPLGLAEYDCSSPGSGSCDLNATVAAGDTIKHGGNTYNISAVSGRLLTYSVDNGMSCGIDQTVSLSTSGTGSPQGAEGLVSSAAGVASAPAAVAEYGSGNTRIGSNGKVYRANPATGRAFNGNGRVTTTSVKTIGAVGGRVAAGAAFAADTKAYRSGAMRGDEYAVNTAVGALGLFGGPPGALGAGIFFTGNALLSSPESQGPLSIPLTVADFPY